MRILPLLQFLNRRVSRLKRPLTLFAVLGSLIWNFTAGIDLVYCLEEDGHSYFAIAGPNECEPIGPHRESDEGSCKDFHLQSSDFGDHILTTGHPSLPSLALVSLPHAISLPHASQIPAPLQITEPAELANAPPRLSHSLLKSVVLLN